MDVKQRLVIALFGPQGSGKGTQGAVLTEKFGIPSFSTGAAMRREIELATEYGRQLKPILEAGKLATPELFEAITRVALARPEYASGVILDGLPRSQSQLALVEEVAPVTLAIEFKIDDDEVVDRLSSRRICEKCGTIYNLITNPPPVPYTCICGGVLVQRNDDQPEAIRQRLAIYYAETEPVIAHYRTLGRVIDIDGRKSIAEVTNDMFAALAARGIHP